MELSPPDGPGGQTHPAYGEEPLGRDLHAAHLVDLMAMAARGHSGAFAELYYLTVCRIHGVVFRVLRSPEHAV